MKLLIYKALTQLIIILGIARQRLGLRRVVRSNRTFFNEVSEIRVPSWGGVQRVLRLRANTQALVG